MTTLEIILFVILFFGLLKLGNLFGNLKDDVRELRDEIDAIREPPDSEDSEPRYIKNYGIDE